MNRSSPKAVEELRFVHVLFDQLPGSPVGEIVSSDRPDALLRTAEGYFGIEVTKLHHPESQHQSRRQESEQEAVVNQAMRMFEKQSSAFLHVTVHFSCNTECNKRNRKHFANCIANLVLANMPSEDGPMTLTNSWNDPVAFPYEIDSIGIYRLSAMKRNFWTVPSAGFVQEDFISELQKMIAKKDKLLAGFQECIEYWLLIVAQNDSASTFFDPSPGTVAHQYQSSFDRVFFLEAFRRRVWEWRTKKS